MAEKGQTNKRKTASDGAADLGPRIVDTAVALAEEVGWDAVRLSEVAARLTLPMAELTGHYRDKDAVADAWFSRARDAMLATPPKGFTALPAETRLHQLMMRWFDALAAHRAVTGQMLQEKLYPSHPHHWVPMIFNLSRTIQLLRDAARLEARGRRRQVEEIGLSALFLATLRVWLSDDSPDQAETRAYLSRRLARADRLMARLWAKTATPNESDEVA